MEDINKLININNVKDLEHFIRIHESISKDTPDHSVGKWNKRAELWEKEFSKRRKGEDRINSAISYLETKGLLDKSFYIADIGCGPGRFVAEFAKRARYVVGLDISDKMVNNGIEYIKQRKLTNTCIKTCDFLTLDIDKEGYREAFDLVFSSMTPAVHGINGLIKSIEMSRGWCCHITHLSGRNFLREKIAKEVFGSNIANRWTGKWFYSLFNILFLLGYNPETTYESIHNEIPITPDEEYAEFLMEHMLPEKECSKDKVKSILLWLKRHTDKEGFVKEVTDYSYGKILWDVRCKTQRPDYRFI